MVPMLEFLGKTFSIYQLTALIGIFTAGGYACVASKRKQVEPLDTITLLLISSIGVVVGMHLLYALTNYKAIIQVIQHHEWIDSFETLIQAVVYIMGGSVFYGGLLGGLIAGYVYVRKKGMDQALWSDLAAPAIPLFHFWGRIGCFLGGCCFGLPSPVGFVYHYSPIPGANGVTRFPIQLVEAAFNLGLFLLLAHLLKREKARGWLMSIYLLSYATVRFILEFFRGDLLRGIWWGLSTSQWISLLVLTVTLADLFHRLSARRRGGTPGAAEDASTSQ